MFWPGVNGTPGKGIGELLRDVDVGVQIEAVRIEVIEAKAKFVDQVVAKSVDLAGGQALGCVLAVAILKAATVEHVVEGRGKEITVVAVAEASEEIIFLADGVVDANVELVLRFVRFGSARKLPAACRV